MASPFPTRATRRARRLRIAGGILASLIPLYFLITSSFFIRAVLLPKVSSSIGANIASESVSFSPFSSLEIRKLVLTPMGNEMLASIDLVRVRYSLTAILGGTLDISELTLENPVIQLIGQADGSFNLPKPGTSSKATSARSTDFKPLALNIRNLTLRNGTLRASTQSTNGTQSIEVTALSLALDRLGGSTLGKLSLSAAVTTRLPDRSQLTGRIEGAYEISLNAALKPELIKGKLTTLFTSASGGLKELSSLGAVLDLDATGSDLRQLGLNFLQDGKSFASVQLAGTYDLTKKEASISYKISDIDRRVIRLGAPTLPFDFGKTVLSAQGRVNLVQQGEQVSSQGRIQINDLTLTSSNGVTPALQISLDYKGGVNLKEGSATVEKVELTGMQAEATLIAGSLDRQMNLSWGSAKKGFRDSTFSLKLTALNSRDWTALTGPGLPSGTLSSSLSLRADRDGRDLKATLDAVIEDIAAEVSGKPIRGLRSSIKLDAALLEFDQIGVSQFTLSIGRQQLQLADLTGALNYNLSSKESGVQISGDLNLPTILAEVPVESLNIASGGLRFSSSFLTKPGTTNISIDLTLIDFAGTVGKNIFKDYKAVLGLSADISGSTLSLQRLTIAPETGFISGGSLTLSGQYDLARGYGKVSYQAVNLNENALAPLVGVAFLPNRLTSIRLDSSGSATFSQNQTTADFNADLKSDLQVSRLLVEDPAGRLPKTPLTLGLTLDASKKNSSIDLHRILIDLGKTTNLLNQLILAGRIDTAKTNPSPSAISLKSDGLDLTSLFTLFGGGAPSTNSVTKSATPATRVPTSSVADVEPAPIVLPFRQLTADIDIARILLKEINVAGLKGQIALTNGSIHLNPFLLKLNDAPISAKVLADVSVPGYRYDVDLKSGAIPLEPFVNSFMPDRRGQIHGTVTLNTALKGTGVTGTNLVSHLTGGFGFTATNLNLKLSEATSPLMKTIIGVVINIPRMIKDPTAAVSGLLTRVTGGSSVATEPWIEQLQAKPLDVITLSGDVSGGTFAIKTARIQSAAFKAEASGGIKILPILTNSSLQIPVLIAIERSLAAQASLLDSGTPTNAVFAPFPAFLTIKGTVGTPKADINYTALAGYGLRAMNRAMGGLGTNIGNKIAGAANLLGNLAGGTKTNATPQIKTEPSTLLNGAVNTFGSLLGGGLKATNRPSGPSTNAPANPVGDLLKAFGRPKN
ncbi:MAG: hypothetical protein EXS25_03375 [Pedosphaera sp.]|nr:hypothetical protein [Pedosphaera sp.]